MTYTYTYLAAIPIYTYLLTVRLFGAPSQQWLAAAHCWWSGRN